MKRTTALSYEKPLTDDIIEGLPEYIKNYVLDEKDGGTSMLYYNECKFNADIIIPTENTDSGYPRLIASENITKVAGYEYSTLGVDIYKKIDNDKPAFLLMDTALPTVNVIKIP